VGGWVAGSLPSTIPTSSACLLVVILTFLTIVQYPGRPRASSLPWV
jgi:hypothetical protein